MKLDDVESALCTDILEAIYRHKTRKLQYNVDFQGDKYRIDIEVNLLEFGDEESSDD